MCEFELSNPNSPMLADGYELYTGQLGSGLLGLLHGACARSNACPISCASTVPSPTYAIATPPPPQPVKFEVGTPGGSRPTYTSFVWLAVRMFCRMLNNSFHPTPQFGPLDTVRSPLKSITSHAV